MKFLHGMIRVKNIEESLKFYCNFLGLKVGEITELEDCKLYFLEDENGDRAIELTSNFEIPQGGYEPGSCFGHFAFGTPDLDEISKKMKEYGYEWKYGGPFILNRINDSDKKTRIAFIEDPNGIEIELIEK